MFERIEAQVQSYVEWLRLAVESLGALIIAAGSAMVPAIVLMIVFDIVHPPAVSTALSFGLMTGDTSNLALFCLSLGITVALLGLQKLSVWLVARDARGGAGKP